MRDQVKLVFGCNEILIEVVEGKLFLTNRMSDKKVQVEPDYQSGLFILHVQPYYQDSQ